MIASPDFAVSLGGGDLRYFNGTITFQKDGLILLAYKTDSLQASVYLRPGVPVEFYKQNTTVYTLSIKPASQMASR